MACLRQQFGEWIDSEPEELTSDRPTEEELTAFENAEKEYESKVRPKTTGFLDRDKCCECLLNREMPGLVLWYRAAGRTSVVFAGRRKAQSREHDCSFVWLCPRRGPFCLFSR